jgi:hypothetical protein
VNSGVVGAAMAQVADHPAKPMPVNGCVIEIADSRNPAHGVSPGV